MKKEKSSYIVFGIIIGILIILILFSSSIIPIFQKNFQKDVKEDGKILHVQKLPVDFEVVDFYIIGLYVGGNNSALKFGQIGIGSTAEKKITIINPFNESVNVSIEVDKNMSRFLNAEDNDFIIKRGENKTVSISAYVNKSEEFGNYSGFLMVVMKKIS